ncbi:amino acid ABC transporter substrate-binding protein [Anaerococcus sp. AGMB00486]|uniref:Amino acid ABC transporter substrate-binding protein n=2 Tax=Anaerococcus TaxID=165779 RepID=A0ABX2NBI3_9FIRM|nr:MULTISPECIES: ABC transporter substrate-binding protein [Anaerococcus]MDY3005903.1 ABC transporter substrate-binding protein [Anaerococcus porci]MSS78032.1 amino acid ABC transporter substrate-binding protein [Anaerococcus porci]NVF11832.1 amino acid ABC transporter substrate-binding protein [Anaerococcus faecalis]
MKNLKKLILVGLAITVFASCGSKDKESASNDASTDKKNTSLVSDGVLDLGTSADFPPYEFYDDNNKIVGIDAEIAEAVGKKLGMEVKIQDMEFANIIASIESGKLDGGISGLSKTPEREKNVNFSDTYAKSVQKVLVKKDSGYKSPEDLKGKKIGTQLGTTGEAVSKDEYGEENVQSFNKNSDAVVALNSGKIDAVVLDEQTVKKFAEANEGLEVLEKSLADDEYAIALDKKNDKLLEEVNKAIKELKEDGTIDKIVNKYIESK